MGIAGLLPLLKSVTHTVHLREYQGMMAGIDAFCWLHRGAFTCCTELVLGKTTDKYIRFCMERVRILQENGITPFMVFDGASIPAKRDLHLSRRAARTEARAKALAVHEEGQIGQARTLFQKAVIITHEMAYELIKCLQEANVRYMVAPYEADAQLAYLARKGVVDLVISEDSDTLPYGCPRVLFKLDKEGRAQEIERRNLALNEDYDFEGWTENMFLDMCLLAGCDYLPNLPGLGIKTAHKLVRQHRTYKKVLGALATPGGKEMAVPGDYMERFARARLTFRHHYVYDPEDGGIVPLTPFTPAHLELDLRFLGPRHAPELARAVAEGRLNPDTLQAYAGSEGERPGLPCRGDRKDEEEGGGAGRREHQGRGGEVGLRMEGVEQHVHIQPAWSESRGREGGKERGKECLAAVSVKTQTIGGRSLFWMQRSAEEEAAMVRRASKERVEKALAAVEGRRARRQAPTGKGDEEGGHAGERRGSGVTGMDEESLGVGVRGSATQGMVLHGHAGRERDRAPSPGGHLERGERKQETAEAGDDREARESEAWEAQEAGMRGCKVGKAESSYFPRRPLAPLRLASSSNAPSGPPSFPFPASRPSQTLHATETDAHVEPSPSIQDAREALSRWEEAERLRRESVAASGRSVSGETVTKRARSAGEGREIGSGVGAKGLLPPMTTAEFQSPMVNDSMETVRRRQRRRRGLDMVASRVTATASHPAAPRHTPLSESQPHSPQGDRGLPRQGTPSGAEEKAAGGFLLPHATSLLLQSAIPSSTSACSPPRLTEFVPPFSQPFALRINSNGQKGPLAWAADAGFVGDEWRPRQQRGQEEQELLGAHHDLWNPSVGRDREAFLPQPGAPFLPHHGHENMVEVPQGGGRRAQYRPSWESRSVLDAFSSSSSLSHDLHRPQGQPPFQHFQDPPLGVHAAGSPPRRLSPSDPPPVPSGGPRFLSRRAQEDLEVE